MLRFVGWLAEQATSLIDKLRGIMPVAHNPQLDGFILPDGTHLDVTRFSQHEDAARIAGSTLAELLAQGIVRYDGRAGVTVGAPLTDAQARAIDDGFKGDTVLVDVMDVKSGRVMEYKKFTRHNADAIRNFVRQTLN
jgi:cytosine/adenosine deaminase-related metal-dependent hydrolase